MVDRRRRLVIQPQLADGNFAAPLPNKPDFDSGLCRFNFPFPILGIDGEMAKQSVDMLKTTQVFTKSTEVIKSSEIVYAHQNTAELILRYMLWNNADL